MHNTQKIAFLIKSMAKEKDITVKQLLENCQLNINTISELSKGKQISYINFAKIADELNCSVDYLLGRTDNPRISNNNSTNINQQYISGNETAHIVSDAIERSDADAQELLDMIKQLSIVQRAEIILKINEMMNE